jgi:integrase
VLFWWVERKGGSILNFVQPIRDKGKIEEIKTILRNESDRNYMIFVIGINTGLRVGDFAKLKIKDVRNRDHIVIIEQKTKKHKRIKITPVLKRELKPYIQDKDEDEYIIKSREGKNQPLGRGQIYNILRNVAEQVGLREIGCHTLRKTFGYHFYQKYKDVAMLQDLFNHSSPAVTLRYIGINDDLKDKAMDNFRI